jgi:hypothetical protein
VIDPHSTGDACMCVYDWVEQGRHQNWRSHSHGRTTTPTLPAGNGHSLSLRCKLPALVPARSILVHCIGLPVDCSFRAAFSVPAGLLSSLSLSLSLLFLSLKWVTSKRFHCSASVRLAFLWLGSLGPCPRPHLRRWFGQARTLI